MRDTSDRIVRITKELRALAVQLQWSTFQKSSRDDKTEILDGLLNTGLVEDLKTAVDQLNHFLWSYINSAAAANAIVESNGELQSTRLDQVTEMLRTLQRPSGKWEEQTGFVERITASVDEHLQACDYQDISSERTA